jgi:hypothetical protein
MADQENFALDLPLYQRRKSTLSLTPLIFGCEENNGDVVRCGPSPNEYTRQAEKHDQFTLRTPFSEKTLTPGFNFERHPRLSPTSHSSFVGSSLGSSDSASFFLSKSPSPGKDPKQKSISPLWNNNVGNSVISPPSHLDCLPIETLEERMNRWVISEDPKKKIYSFLMTPPSFQLGNGVPNEEEAARKDEIHWKNSSPINDSYLVDRNFYLCSPRSLRCSSNSPQDSRSDVRSPIGSPSLSLLPAQTHREHRKSRRDSNDFEFPFVSSS